MSQSQDNLLKLAMLCRGDKKQFKACCETAQKLKLPSPKRQLKQPSAQAQRLKNFVGRIPPAELHSAIARFGATAVHNRISADSILEAAAAKFAAMALQKAGA